MLWMDKDNCTTDISKDFAPVCYSINCNKTPTKSIRIPLNGTIGCPVYVCDSCLPKYEIADYANDTIADRTDCNICSEGRNIHE
jgi:hypothetical protein